MEIVLCSIPLLFFFFYHSEIFTHSISYPYWTVTCVATDGLRNTNPCHASPRVRESRGNGNGGTAAGAAADERPFFCSLHKCAILLNTWRKFKHISPLSYSSLEETELSFIRKVTSFVFLRIISQCDLAAAVTLFCVIYITWFI